MTRVDLPDLAAMARFGADIAAQLRPGDVIALSGGLGAGKTAPARAIVPRWGMAAKVPPSPSFAIIELYDGPEMRHARWSMPIFGSNARQTQELGLDDYRDGASADRRMARERGRVRA
ncbi:MAG: tRNA (adenosine(37)-N6)-threonylcarbamoyltransferase complex ATPase subunit type 1 TsaE [Caenibius sp.]